MFTQTARPRIFLALALLIVGGLTGLFFWRTHLRLPVSNEAANRYLPNSTDLQVKAASNSEAYALYLRARELEAQGSSQSLRAAQDLFQEAIAADKTFALAHARLAVVLARIGTSATEQQRAREEAAEALRSDPKLADAHFALALLSAGDERYADAVPEIELALTNQPDDSEMIYLSASLHRRQGRWKEALAEFQKAVALSPRNFNGPTDLAYHLSLMRDWPAAVPAWDRALAIVPEYMFNRICRAYVDVWAHGDVSRGKALLGSFSPDYAGQFKEFLAWMRWDLNLLQHNYDASAQGIDNIKEDPALGGFLGPITRSYMRGCIELARGNREAATPLFAESCKFFEERVSKAPNRAQPHIRLAMVYAFMGRKAEALAEAAKAQELCPESKDAFDGICISTGVAVVYTWASEPDKAVSEIERLLRTPGALNYDLSITLNDLKYRWLWDPLRADPRFQQIIAGPEPQTIVR